MMKLSNCLAAALLLMPVITSAQDKKPEDSKQAFFAIFAETAVTKMVGMPEMPEMPEMPALPPGMKLPGGIKMPSFGKPERHLTIRLWSPTIAPNDAFATLGIPDGLKLGDKLNLEIYRPKPDQTSGEVAIPNGPDGKPMKFEFVIKRYWGSSTTVRPGQPEVIDMKALSPDQQSRMREQSQKMQAGSYFYKPNWTTGHWPTSKQPGDIDKQAVMPGHYALTTNYTGNVEIDVPDKVNFLAPIVMSEPDLSGNIDLNKYITFTWKAVPNALGLHASMMGMARDHKTMILWSSSEIKAEAGYSYDYLQMAEVAALVKTTEMMEGKRITVSVPVAIFKDCDMVMFNMVGFGPGTALDKAQPLPRVQTKTTLSIMLGSPMGGMGGMGGMAEPGTGDQ